MSARRRAAVGIVLALALALPLSALATRPTAPQPSAAPTPPPRTVELVAAGPLQLVNADRTARGLRALTRAADLDASAQRWANRMAGGVGLNHDPRYGDRVCCWRTFGENIGRGSGWGQLQPAFMRSASHRSNILDPRYTDVGFGIAPDPRHPGAYYVVQHFRQRAGARATPRKPAPRKPRAKPKETRCG